MTELVENLSEVDDPLRVQTSRKSVALVDRPYFLSLLQQLADPLRANPPFRLG